MESVIEPSTSTPPPHQDEPSSVTSTEASGSTSHPETKATHPTANSAESSQTPRLWERWPSIKIIKPPQGENSYTAVSIIHPPSTLVFISDTFVASHFTHTGRYSPKADERCLTYCSQTARGRAEGNDPWCRSICIRRVFAHEVDAIISRQNAPSGFPNTNTGNGVQQQHQEQETEQVRYPLPLEGQPPTAVVDGVVGGTSASGRSAAEDVRYWEAGWYVWLSKSRWAAQERLDLMMSDLEHQTWWMRVKEQEERAWLEAERARSHGDAPALANQDASVDMGQSGHHMPPAMVPGGDEDNQDAHRTRHPRLTVAEQSLLVKLPPPLHPLDRQMRTLLEPTGKVLEMLRGSLASGAQQKLAERMWETAWTGAPFTLARNVLVRVWERLNSDDDPPKE